MRTFPKILLILFSLLLSTQITMAACYSQGSGNWEDPDTWLCSGVPSVPSCGDTIYIQAGHTVTITDQKDFSEPGCATPMFIIIDGELHFQNGKKLYLPCNSGITINAGGSITDGGGGGNSNLIDICGSTVWRSADGPLFGPMTLGVALPVELIAFEAHLEGNKVMLSWSTASEKNNDYFTVERSSNGLTFVEIAEVPGTGNSSTQNDYETIDGEPQQGVSYYRLKQTDHDGKFEYFDMVAINYEVSSGGSCILKVYPNPCIGRCTVSLANCKNNENADIVVEVFDVAGNKVYSKIPNRESNGSFEFSLDANNNLSPGVYIVRGASFNEKYQRKVIVK